MPLVRTKKKRARRQGFHSPNLGAFSLIYFVSSIYSENCVPGMVLGPGEKEMHKSPPLS